MKNLLFFINHIDNSITKTFIYYFIVLTFTISAFMIGMTANIISNKGEIKIENSDGSAYLDQSINFKSFDENGNKIVDNMEEKSTFNKSVIFGSSKGKYFYYKGCGGDSIAAKNLRYYKSEAEAIKLGKLLYNKCK